LILTDLTKNAIFLPGRVIGQLKRASGAMVGLFNEGFDDILARSEALHTDRKGF
jgi:hypothetical protein